MNSRTHFHSEVKSNKLPVFLCYRQADGSLCADIVYRLIHGSQIYDSNQKYRKGRNLQIDVYYDQAAPISGNWKEIHEPHLARSRAFVLICTPGSALNEGPYDWVHLEIEWWLSNRKDLTPIIIEATSHSNRFVPASVKKMWPDAQRIIIDPSVIERFSPEQRRLSEKRYRERILTGIIPNSENFYRNELEAERERVRQLEQAITKQQTREREILGLIWLYTLTENQAKHEFHNCETHISLLYPLLHRDTYGIASTIDRLLIEISDKGVPIEKGKLSDFIGDLGFFRFIVDIFSKKNKYVGIFLSANILELCVFCNHTNLFLLSIVLRILESKDCPKVISKYRATRLPEPSDSFHLSLIHSVALCDYRYLTHHLESDDYLTFFGFEEKSTDNHNVMPFSMARNLFLYIVNKYHSRSFDNEVTEAEFVTLMTESLYRPYVILNLALMAEIEASGKTKTPRIEKINNMIFEFNYPFDRLSSLHCIEDYVTLFRKSESHLRLIEYRHILWDRGLSESMTNLIKLNDSIASSYPLSENDVCS